MIASKKRILFVDDEPAILAGLQNLLYRQRARWDLVFASSGEHALAEMRRGAFDVVVSDMRMPGMDGAELLTRVKTEFPQTVRIMLSGHADRESIVRALPALHQLLSKPCDGATLRGVIERSLDGGAVSSDVAIRAVIGKLDKLPSPPALFHDMTAALESPSASLGSVARIVERDPAMCAKVLQLVNSSYFHTGQVTSSIEHAIAYLGTERLRYIVLTASVFAPLERAPFSGFSVDRLQQTSLAVARMTERLVGGKAGHDPFVAGLLHDLGQLVLALGIPEQLAAIFARARDTGEAQSDIERSVLGVNHAEVGAYLLQIWGVPDPVVAAVRAHHDPAQALENARELAAAIHVADALLDDACGPARGRARIRFEQLDAIGLGDRARRWCEAVT